MGHLLGCWQSHYLGSFLHKPIFKSVWNALPKFIYWQIWLVMNKAIFKGEIPLFGKVPSKAIIMMSESFITQYLKLSLL